MRRAVFLDRDGVLTEPVVDSSGLPESPLDPEDVAIAPGAADAAVRLSALGYLLIGVSNQPAAAKGTVPQEQLDAVQSRALALLAAAGVKFAAFEICRHHPDGVLPALSGVCDCRKPAPGMLLRAAQALDVDLSSSWMIGDSDSDVQAGQGAGVRTILVEHSGSAHRRSGSVAPDATVANLAGAAALIASTGR